jgi:hypothetical protein
LRESGEGSEDIERDSHTDYYERTAPRPSFLPKGSRIVQSPS